MQPHRHSIIEVAFAKNEGRFFLEWIAYHRLIGVTEFLIYTNDCEDDSPALLQRLQEMELGVTHVPNPVPPCPVSPTEQPQNKALNRAVTHPLVLNAEYVLQIDPDEFLCVKVGAGTLRDLIATAPEADVICTQMRFFGDSGLPRLGDGMVTELLTHAAQESYFLNGIVKSLAKNSGVFSKITANHVPGFDMMPPGTRKPRIFNAGGREIAPEAYNHARFRTIPDAYRSMAFAQLNHYAVRTLSDYRAKKYRGTPANNDQKLTMRYWHERNRNEVRDTHVQRFVAPVRALMNEWLKDPLLAARNRRCFEAYEDILRKSEGIFGDESDRAPPGVTRRRP